MIQAEKIVEMFRRDLETNKQELKELKNDSNNTKSIHYGKIYEISIIVEYLEHKFELLRIIEEVNKSFEKLDKV